jgi:GrpB-like predicted nucleotidyltransferase (UPF0157 family)
MLELAVTMGMEVVLSPYETVWAQEFEDECERLRRHAGDLFTDIDHIGSTSVPGLAAKPIIDIQAQVDMLEDPEYYEALFGPLGYRVIDSEEVDVRIALRKRVAGDANLHIVKSGSWAAERTLLFRDALRGDAVLAEEYARLKYDLLASSESLFVYTLAKTEFIEDALRRRCEELELLYNPGNRR